MADYSIGLSGLTAAQRAFDVIGNNIANAATEGYHRQKLMLSPAYSQNPNTATFIGGVNVDGVSRMIDTLLEQEILHQNSSLAAFSQQTATLGTIEAALGEMATEDGGLNAAIDNFFTSLQDLSTQPDGNVWQNQAVSNAELMTSQFRSLGEFLESLQNQIKLEAESETETINSLVDQIADLNQQIERIYLIGGQTNSMNDQRDQYVSQLSELIEIETVNRKHGVVDISAGGLGLVTGAFSTHLKADTDDNGQLGLAIADTSNYTTDIDGGKIGGLLTLQNTLVAGCMDDLDALSNAIMTEINNYHVMGIGSAGSFTQLTGESFISGQLSDIANITNGALNIRVTNTDTGEITRHAIAIDAANDTISDVAAAIAAIPGLTTSLNSSNQLTITAGADYKFDFVPAVLPEPTLVDFDDASPPAVTVSGIYNGTENDTFEFKVIGDGSVGNGTLSLEVRANNGSGDLIKTLSIGSGYAADEVLDVGNGIKIALSVGSLAESDGDRFCVDALADSDTAGFLSATGLNTFFSGSSALDMTVCAPILENPQRVATSIGADGTDNDNIARMADVKNKTIDALGSLTCGQFYQKFVANIGQEISTKQMQQENTQAVLLNLTNRQSDISGVNINEEAAQMLVFEQMFQAMAKYMNTINDSITSLMEIV